MESELCHVGSLWLLLVLSVLLRLVFVRLPPTSFSNENLKKNRRKECLKTSHTDIDLSHPSPRLPLLFAIGVSRLALVIHISRLVGRGVDAKHNTGEGGWMHSAPLLPLQLYIYPERQRRPRLMGAPVKKRASRAAAAALLHKKDI